MAVTGSVTGTTGNANIASRISWSYTQNISANTSTLTVSLQFSRTNIYNGNPTSGSGTFVLYIDGKSYAHTVSSFTISNTQNAWTDASLIQTTVDIPHAADGSRSVAISASGSLPPSSLSSVTCSTTLALATIPRASSISCSSSTAELGSDVAITITRASSKFTHNITYVFDGTTGDVTGTVSTSATTGATLKTQLSWASNIPAATSAKCTITCQTKDASGTAIGDPVKKTITLTVPSTVKITANSGWVTLKPYSTNATVNGWSVYAQGLTSVQATIDTSKIAYTNAYGATISKYELTIAGQSTINANSSQTVVRQANTKTGDSISVTVVMTDTRGRTNKYTESIKVWSYAKPMASSIKIFRSDASGNAAPSGTRLTAYAAGTVSSLNGKNALTLQVSGSGITTTTITNEKNTVLTGTVEVNKSYALKLTASDTVGNESTYTVNVATAHATANSPDGGHGIAFGKYYDSGQGSDTMQVGYNAEFDGNLTAAGVLSVGGLVVDGEDLRSAALTSLGDLPTSGYTSADNPFTAPADGYLRVYTGSSSGTKYSIIGTNGTSLGTTTLPTESSAVVFVRRGMKIWASGGAYNGAVFYALT